MLSSPRSLIFYTALVLLAPLTLPAQDIPYQMRVLDNGLTVIVHEDSKAPVVAVNIWYHVGSKNESPGRTGFAHLFEHLMFQGSENFDGELLNYLQELGATDLNATTWFDRTNYFQTVPKSALDTVLFLESDRMGHFAGAITQAKLDEQRGVVQNEKRQGENQPYGKVWETMLPQIFPPGHPYSWETIGSMADLDAATLDDVREWFSTWYGPNNAVLVVAGDVDYEDIFSRVEKYFGDIPPGPTVSRLRRWIPRHETERRLHMTDRVPQARVYMVWPGPAWGSQQAHHLALALAILGGDKNSRLYERLVYREQIATDATAAPLALEIAGVTYLSASAQPGGSLADVEAALREELARFAKDGPKTNELERVKTQTRATFLRGIEKVGGYTGKAGILAQSMIYGGSPDAYKNELANVDAATKDDVRQAVRDWLDKGVLIVEVHPEAAKANSTTGVDRGAGPPAAEAMPPVSFPKFTRHTLSNGLKVIVAKRQGVPLVNLSLLLDAGYAADQFSRPGTSSLTMAMLDEGTKKRSALEISDALAQQGAVFYADSDLDTSNITMSALAENLDTSLEIFADVALQPIFPQAELERLRRINLANIQQEKQSPISMALRVLPGLMYGDGHPYAQPLTGSGTEQDLRAMTRENLSAFHKAWFKPNHASLLVVGDVDVDSLLATLEKRFGDWSAGEIPKKVLANPAQKASRVLYLVDKPDADQSVIFAGQLIPPRANPDEVAIKAMNNILGGKSSARINMNLREDKGWSYGAYSLILDARGPRPLLTYAPVQADKTREAISEILSEFEAIQTDRPPAEQELQTVVRSDTLSLPGRWEAGASVLSSLMEIVRYDLPDEYWSNYADSITSLGLDEVQRVATDLLRPDELYWVIVGDRRKISAGLEDLGFDEIRLLDSDGKLVTDSGKAN